ncbi:ATP synthase subunit I [Neptunomonas antarctica]
MFFVVLLMGGLLGSIFFGGLWWTVHKGVISKHPVWWFLGSLILRMGIVLPGIYWVANADLLRLFICLLGFIMARFMVIRLTRLSSHASSHASSHSSSQAPSQSLSQESSEGSPPCI